MSQNDPDEINPVISMDSGVFNLSDENRKKQKDISSPCSDFNITFDNLSNNFKSVEKIKETALKSPNLKPLKPEELETPSFKKWIKPSQELDEMEFTRKKKDYYANKLLNDQRNNLKQNFHMYQQGWLDNLREIN